MAELNKHAVRSALEDCMCSLDYDLHKSIECDEETGEDGYPELTDYFITCYQAALEAAAS